MKIQFAEKCAWRAIYVQTDLGYRFFHIGVDPNDGVQPKCFGRVSVRLPVRNHDGRYLLNWGWRFTLPWVAWGSTYRKPHWFWLPLYKVMRRFWHNVDGRF